jgi:hypothetical protein
VVLDSKLNQSHDPVLFLHHLLDTVKKSGKSIYITNLRHFKADNGVIDNSFINLERSVY